MNKNYPTPHINATPNDFAKTVIMPGDPNRSEFIAKNFLTNAKLINDVRGVKGYTGEYQNKKVSVMASGMGMPSMGIYSYELFNFFGVENIIRAGSAGAISEDVMVKDIILGMGASTNSAYFNQFGIPGTFCATSDFNILKNAKEIADELNINTHVGTLLSSDFFYDDDPQIYKKWKALGVLGIEMEAASLYINAKKANKKALAMCTVSDQIVTGERLTSKEREENLTQMIELALKTAISL